MSVPLRCGALAGPGQSSETWKLHLDPSTGALNLPRQGWFWEAVATANLDQKLTGDGSVIAIVDAGFDTEILARSVPNLRQSTRFPVISENVDLFDGHGTVVALLVNQVAPAAELLLVDVGAYHGSLVPQHVSLGIEAAVEDRATIINASVQFPSSAQPVDRIALPFPADEAELCAQLDVFFKLVEPYADARCRGRCMVCSALETVPQDVVVIAATGQVHESTCPAASRRVIGAAFERTTRTSEGGHFTIRHEPGETESIAQRGEVTIEEPPGFVGTSFASPLVAGFAALVQDPYAFEQLSRLPKALTPLLRFQSEVLTVRNELVKSGEARGLDPQSMYLVEHGVIRAGVEHARSLVPPEHRHWEQPDASACGLCELFARDLYIVDATDRIEAGERGESLRAAELAVNVCPRSPAAANNLVCAQAG